MFIYRMDYVKNLFIKVSLLFYKYPILLEKRCIFAMTNHPISIYQSQQ